jgi:hypothetical protein
MTIGWTYPIFTVVGCSRTSCTYRFKTPMAFATIIVCLGTRRILILFATMFGFFENKSDFISLFLILS